MALPPRARRINAPSGLRTRRPLMMPSYRTVRPTAVGPFWPEAVEARTGRLGVKGMGAGRRAIEGGHPDEGWRKRRSVGIGGQERR